MLRVAAFLILTILPGAWISFGFSLQKLAFWARLLVAVMLAPLVIAVEFFPLRLLGASFERTALLLVLINLPALILIWRHARRMESPGRQTILIWAFVLLFSVACIVPSFLHPQTRMYYGHPWLYSEPVYMLARGDVIPEDPDLAGFRLSYPVWSGLIQQTVLSYFLDSPPMCSFIWTGLVCLIAACGFVIGAVEELGGGWFAKVSACIWLSLSANSVGYVLKPLLPRSFTGAVQIWGDGRYTPWVWKFHDYNSMPLILAIIGALVYLLIRRTDEKPAIDSLAVMALLLSCVGVFYPILYPAACAILGARALAALIDQSNADRQAKIREFVGYMLVLLVSAAFTFANYKFMTHDRVVGGLVQISKLTGMARKSLEYFVVASPLLVGLAIVLRRSWQERRVALVTLAVGALGSLFLTAFFFLPYWSNEYKFMFTAVICLAPLASLASEDLWQKLGAARALPIVGLAYLFFIGAYVYQMSRLDWALKSTPQAQTVQDSFYVGLAPQERQSRIFAATREKTPPDTILAIQNADWHPPTFTSRSLYVAYRDKPFSGVNQGNNVLIDRIKGYGPQIMMERRQTLTDLFESAEDSRRAQALGKLQEMKRPIAVFLEPSDAALLAWLQANTSGTSVFQENGLTLWLIQPAAR